MPDPADPAGEPVIQKRFFKHAIVLTEISADTPANRSVSKWLGHAAYLGCGHCKLRGQRDGHGMYRCGYWKPAQTGAQHTNDAVPKDLVNPT